jgi:hypothetical protein
MSAASSTLSDPPASLVPYSAIGKTSTRLEASTPVNETTATRIEVAMSTVSTHWRRRLQHNPITSLNFFPGKT